VCILLESLPPSKMLWKAKLLQPALRRAIRQGSYFIACF
jgi:hypothetical protein